MDTRTLLTHQTRLVLLITVCVTHTNTLTHDVYEKIALGHHVTGSKLTEVSVRSITECSAMYGIFRVLRKLNTVNNKTKNVNLS